MKSGVLRSLLFVAMMVVIVAGAWVMMSMGPTPGLARPGIADINVPDITPTVTVIKTCFVCP